MKKRIVSMLLAVMLVVGLVPAAMAFSDVDDAELAAKIDLLAELGIINGYTDGTFRPNQPLTRAEFTKLVVTMLGRQDDRVTFAGYTIFTDVVSGHWAAGYINLAARSVDKGGLALVKGYTDGSFRPDATITYGEAVTIVLRALGYTDADVGFNWPQDYVDKASISGLGDGVSLDADDIVGRADGARIFYNALFVESKDGKKLIDGVYGDVISSALIIAVDADGVLLYGEEEKLLNAAGLTADAVGKRYELTLWNDNERIMLAQEATQRFTTTDRVEITEVEVVDGFTYVTYGTAGEALCLAEIDAEEDFKDREFELLLDRASGVILGITELEPEVEEDKTVKIALEFAYYSGDEVTDVSGEVVKIPADTKVYTTPKGIEGDSTTFAAVRDHLSYGDRFTVVYDEDGKLLHILALTGEPTVAVLAPGMTQSEALAALGASEDAKIYKNGVEVGFSDLGDYDVLSYSAGGAINVSDFRLNAVYTYATPNLAAPTAITVFGSTIRLAPCAQESVTQYAPLERMTLLFAADGRIAGAMEQTNERRVGIYNGTAVEFIGGPTIDMALADFEAGDLVSVGVDAKGEPSGYPVREKAVSVPLDLKLGTVGDAKLAKGCVFYESAADGATPMRVDRADILAETVAAEDILHVGYDSSGQVAVVILGDVTGDSYTYGRMKVTTEERTRGGSVLSVTYTAYAVELSQGDTSVSADMRQLLTLPEGMPLSDRYERLAWGGVVTGEVRNAGGSVEEQIVAVKLLEESVEVGRADFVGSTAVRVGDETMPIADGVLVWLESTEVFMDASDYDDQLRLVSAARAQSDSFELLVSEGKVRVIIVK